MPRCTGPEYADSGRACLRLLLRGATAGTFFKVVDMHTIKTIRQLREQATKPARIIRQAVSFNGRLRAKDAAHG